MADIQHSMEPGLVTVSITETKQVTHRTLIKTWPFDGGVRVMWADADYMEAARYVTLTKEQAIHLANALTAAAR